MKYYRICEVQQRCNILIAWKSNAASLSLFFPLNGLFLLNFPLLIHWFWSLFAACSIILPFLVLSSCCLADITLRFFGIATGHPELGRLVLLHSTLVLSAMLVDRRRSVCLHWLLTVTLRKVFVWAWSRRAESVVFSWTTWQTLSIHWYSSSVHFVQIFVLYFEYFFGRMLTEALHQRYDRYVLNYFKSRITLQNLRRNFVLSWMSNQIGLHVDLTFRDAIQNMQSWSLGNSGCELPVDFTRTTIHVLGLRWLLIYEMDSN